MSDRDRTKSGHGRSSDSSGTGKESTREPPPCLNAKKCAFEKHYLSDCSLTSKDEGISMLAEYKKKASLKTLGSTERWRSTEMDRPRTSRRRNSESRSQCYPTQALTTQHISQCCAGRKEAWLPSQGGGAAGANHAEHGYQGRKRQTQVQCSGDMFCRQDQRFAIIMSTIPVV
jgi:hypothetical protein